MIDGGLTALGYCVCVCVCVCVCFFLGGGWLDELSAVYFIALLFKDEITLLWYKCLLQLIL
jgi:hypothetical protein